MGENLERYSVAELEAMAIEFDLTSYKNKQRDKDYFHSILSERQHKLNE
jgi:hypothetical protein